jgi:hypothetical protein
VLTFGKYKMLPKEKKTLDAIAETDQGLQYLDWLRGSLHENGCQDWQMPTRDALDVYLNDETIVKELRRIVARKLDGPARTSISRDYAQRCRQQEMGF